jgi:hypothetical protein
MAKRVEVATVGYQGATVHSLLQALREAGIEVLVDVRAVASSRRPGFAKSALAANLAGAGIDYLHLRDRGTPAPGRAAARAGRHTEMRRIYGKHLETPTAQAAHVPVPVTHLAPSLADRHLRLQGRAEDD